MTDHFSQAERQLKPADPGVAQVHATLAVAEQLARIATALERLAGGQGGPES
jgi:hypothetical protein